MDTREEEKEVENKPTEPRQTTNSEIEIGTRPKTLSKWSQQEVEHVNKEDEDPLDLSPEERAATKPVFPKTPRHPRRNIMAAAKPLEYLDVNTSSCSSYMSSLPPTPKTQKAQAAAAGAAWRMAQAQSMNDLTDLETLSHNSSQCSHQSDVTKIRRLPDGSPADGSVWGLKFFTKDPKCVTGLTPREIGAKILEGKIKYKYTNGKFTSPVYNQKLNTNLVDGNIDLTGISTELHADANKLRNGYYDREMNQQYNLSKKRRK